MKQKILPALLLTLILSCSIVAQQNNTIDSLENLLSTNLPDTSRLSILTKLTKFYLKQKGGLEMAKNYADEGFKLTEEKSLKVPYKLNWAMAKIYHKLSKPHKAVDEMKIAVKKLSGSENTAEIAEASNFLGWLYYYAGMFTESIETYNQNIEFARENQIDSIIPSAYSGIAYVYYNLEQTEDEKRTLYLMLEASRQENDIKSEAEAYFKLGDIGMMQDSNFVFAIENYKQCLKLRKELFDTSYIAFTILRIGWNYYLNGDLDTSLYYFFNSLDYSIPINKLMSITNAYGNIGTIYRDKKEYKKALKYYDKSIKYSIKANDMYNLSWLYKDMSTMYASLSDYKMAYENLLLHKRYSDSLEMKKYNKSMADARTRYEADKNQKELEFLSFKLEQHKYFTYGFAGAIFLVVVIGILLIRQNKLNAKRRISEMNHKISEMTQKNLRQQMNPHFIFNTLNSIQYYMYQHDKISTNNYLTKFSSLMRKTLENSQHTSIPIKDEIDALELYLQLESLRFKEKFDYEINIDEEIDTLLYKIPTMLIQPYVENAICHGLINMEGKGNLKVDLKLFKDSIACTIKDNGIGREAAQEIKKKKNSDHNSLGTTITESRLKLVNALYGKNMKIEYADLKDENGNPCGTRVEIHIPIMT